MDAGSSQQLAVGRKVRVIRDHTGGARGRLVLSAVVGGLAYSLAPLTWAWEARIGLGWDFGAAVMLLMAWQKIAHNGPVETRALATNEDPGRAVAWVLTLLSSVFSLFAATMLLRKDQCPGLPDAAKLAVGLVGVATSWALTHTTYTLRYARLYYRGEADPAHHGRHGLVFNHPEGKQEPPTDMDFAYFAFTIGICFQTSDVEINDRSMRRAVLGHAVLSYIYSTVIIGLVMSLVFNRAS